MFIQSQTFSSVYKPTECLLLDKNFSSAAANAGNSTGSSPRSFSDGATADCTSGGSTSHHTLGIAIVPVGASR
jgi:hypothetical protein